MMPPRAVLTMNAPRFMRARRAALNSAEVSGVFGQWMRDEIGARQAASRSLDLLASGGADRLGGDVGIVDQHRHVEAQAAPGDARADAAEADDQHGLARQLHRQPGMPVGPRAPARTSAPSRGRAWPAPSSCGTPARRRVVELAVPATISGTRRAVSAGTSTAS